MSEHRSTTAFCFGTKAETLLALSRRLHRFSVPELTHFSVQQWREARQQVLAGVMRRFAATPRVIVRSSARIEDSCECSMAGAFKSFAHIDPRDAASLAACIEETIASYQGDPRDQVIIQRMVEDVEAAGVVMTHVLEDGSPYYVLNYDDESGRTDVITGGSGEGRTVFVYRGVEDAAFDSERVLRIVNLARELEHAIGPTPMDIEFALDTHRRMHLLQVRPIAVSRQWNPAMPALVEQRIPRVTAFLDALSCPRPGLAGSRTILSNMSDWNPAEIIGANPRPLAASLYRHIITRSAWRKARERMGYQRLPAQELMVLVAGRPFIDVRASFNSFLPGGLEPGDREVLVDAWLDRLARHPEYHDKVEFEVAHTVADFDLEARFEGHYAGVVPPEVFDRFRERLLALTRANLGVSEGSSLAAARREIERLDRHQEERGEPDLSSLSAPALASLAADLLEECRELGAIPFSILARHAFMAEAMLRSATLRGALAPERVLAFKRGVRTVMGDFGRDLDEVAAGRMSRELFLKRYGHLRPGTYDILSPRYADRPGLFDGPPPPDREHGPEPFVLTPAEARGLDGLLAERGLPGLDARELLAHAEQAIVGREWGKFVFTRNLSLAIEALAAWGQRQGLDREELSFLAVPDILDTLQASRNRDVPAHLRRKASRARQAALENSKVKLSYILRSRSDVFVAPQHRSAPNYIGVGRVNAPVALVSPGTPSDADLQGRVVCIENADPGFDWIFTKGIAGLVTQYGGANSHMAIRAAEFGLPAAIGCGERLFSRVSRSARVDLNCAEKNIRTDHD